MSLTTVEISERNRVLCKTIQHSSNPDDIEAARTELVKINAGLVYPMARKWSSLLANATVIDEEDLVQAGYMGILKAADMFDLDKGVNFSTYATFWINQVVTRQVEVASEGFITRIPVHALQLYNRCRKTIGENKSDSDFLDEVAKSDELSAADKSTIFYVYYAKNGKSLNEHVGDDSESDTDCLGDFIPDEVAGPEETTITSLRDANIHELLGELSEREQWIIEHRFGFNGNDVMTLEQCGEQYPWGSITRERIRQIERRAIERLKGKVNKTKYSLIRECRATGLAAK